MDTIHTSHKVHKTVSVVMATFNGALFLEKQMHSILQQSLMPVSIIICDDGSTDDTVNILKKFSNQYPIIKYFVNEERLGVIGNFKKAVSLASDADFIALSDQDDIWFPDKLEKLCENLSVIDDGQAPAMVYSDLVVIDGNEKILNPSFWNELGHDGYTHNFETLLFGNFVTGCTILMNQPMRNHFARMPADVLMHDAWLALIAFSFGKVDVIPEPLVKYRRHNTNAAFLTTYQKKNTIQKWLVHIKLLFTKNDYLKDQLQLVQMFMDAYGNLLKQEQAEKVNTFLQLRNRSYLRKKLLFKTFFKNHWLRK